MKHIQFVSKTPQKAQLSTNPTKLALLEIMEALVRVNRAADWKAIGLPGGEEGTGGGTDTGVDPEI